MPVLKPGVDNITKALVVDSFPTPRRPSQTDEAKQSKSESEALLTQFNRAPLYSTINPRVSLRKEPKPETSQGRRVPVPPGSSSRRDSRDRRDSHSRRGSRDGRSDGSGDGSRRPSVSRTEGAPIRVGGGGIRWSHTSTLAPPVPPLSAKADVEDVQKDLEWLSSTGRVKTELTTKEAKNARAQEQGNLAYYTEEALMSRKLIYSDDKFQQSVRKLWDFPPKLRNGNLPEVCWHSSRDPFDPLGPLPSTGAQRAQHRTARNRWATHTHCSAVYRESCCHHDRSLL